MTFELVWVPNTGHAEIKPGHKVEKDPAVLEFLRYWPKESMLGMARVDFRVTLTCMDLKVLGHVVFYDQKPFVQAGSDAIDFGKDLTPWIGEEAKKLLDLLPESKPA